LLAASREWPADPHPIPDFTIPTTDPARTIYAILKYCRDREYVIQLQRVVGTRRYEIRIGTFGNEVILLLTEVEGGVRSEGSFVNGDEKIFAEKLEPLIRSLMEAGQP
jgi:hypothetical protein